KVWEPRQALRAVCGKFETTHDAPWMTCHCGVHAYRQEDKALEHFNSFINRNGDEVVGWAFGKVSLWGRTVEHEDGWRSEWAYPLSLTVYADDPRTADAIRELYGVDVKADRLVDVDPEEDVEEDELDPELQAVRQHVTKLRSELKSVHDGIRIAALEGLLTDEHEQAMATLTISTAISRLRGIQNDLREVSSIQRISRETKINLAEVIRDVKSDLFPRLTKAEKTIKWRQEAAARAQDLAERNALPPIRLGAFTDKQVLAALKKALREAAAEDKKRGSGRVDRGVWASCVADALAGKKRFSGPPNVQPGDVNKVGKCLAKLAREGRVVLVSKSYEPRRYELPEHADA
ncbi:MAG TPA: hypothetical protein VGT98_11915, partial [Candidatus Elarobacter sp.]|nr:hypothetical protein [Candidatus Elarobacter sp.]